jgi:hypothetical protein
MANMQGAKLWDLFDFGFLITIVEWPEMFAPRQSLTGK